MPTDSIKDCPRNLIPARAEVYPIYDEPDGININSLCGSTYQKIFKNIVEMGADVGLPLMEC